MPVSGDSDERAGSQGEESALLALDRKALDAGRAYIDHTVAVGAFEQRAAFVWSR